MIALLLSTAFASDWEADFERQQKLAKLGAYSAAGGAGLVTVAVAPVAFVDDPEVVLAFGAPFTTVGAISMIGGNTSGSIFAWRAARSLQAGGVEVSTVPAKVGLAGVALFYGTALLMPVVSSNDQVPTAAVAVPAYGGLAAMYAGSFWQIRTNRRAYEVYAGPTAVGARW